jgi:cobalt-zinc-cadmium efflux system outer membrane protein
VARFASRNLALLLLLSAPAVVAAQVPGEDTLRISIDDAAARAVAVSPELARERLEIDRARAERLERGAFFPELPELDYRQTTDAPFAGEGEGGWELGLTQEIELGGQSFLRRQAGDLGVVAAELRVRSAELSVRAEAREAFARLAAAEVRLRLVDSLTVFARRLDTVAGRLLAAEEISELERNAVRIERGRRDVERLRAEAEVAAARTELGALIAVPPRMTITTLPTSPVAERVRAALVQIERVEAAIASGDSMFIVARPDWQALERLRERASLERTIASRRGIPNVAVGVGLESEASASHAHQVAAAGESAVTGASPTERDLLFAFNLGIRLPLPIPGLYDIGQGEVAIAESEYAIAVAEQRVLEYRIRTEVARAAARLRPAAQALDLYAREIAPLIGRNLELLERGYRAGELSATEVIAQQQQFASAGEALIEAELEFNEAYAQFERALGR